MDSKALKNICQHVVRVVQQAGNMMELQKKAAPSFFTHKVDGSRVTAVDIYIEDFLIKELQLLFPEASVCAEESGYFGSHKKYVWVIDPLDGTTNYTLSIPYYCISVALVYEHETLIAVMYHPATQELFYAIKNNGFYYNKKLFKKNHTLVAKHSVIGCTGMMYEAVSQNIVSQLAQKVYSIRILGSIALDMAYCAAGKLDGFICHNAQWWDYAAGCLFIQESGCFAKAWGKHSIPYVKNLMGGSKLIFSLLTDVVQKNIRDC